MWNVFKVYLRYKMGALTENRLKSFLCSTKDRKNDIRDLMFQRYRTHALIEKNTIFRWKVHKIQH